MSANPQPTPPQPTPPLGPKGDETRKRLKRAAKRLFALHGVDGVTVREIVLAAGQRNVGSLNYYFGAKEALLREVLIDGAKIIDGRYSRQLDAIEARGGPSDVREVIEILVRATGDFDWDDGPGDEEDDHNFIRFCLKVAISDRVLFLEETAGKFDAGHRRCMAHIRRLVPHDNHELFVHRIHCMLNLLSAGLSVRETGLEMPRETHGRLDSMFRSWLAPAALENLIDAMVGVLVQPVSPAALALAAKPKKD